jgi:hypothetical protein
MANLNWEMDEWILGYLSVLYEAQPVINAA